MPRGQRSRIGRFYAHRNRDGQFTRWVSIARSHASDLVNRRARKPIGRNRGHTGDY